MWRSAFNDVPRLGPIRRRALKLIEHAQKTHEGRTIILHGRWLRFVATDPLTVEVERQKRRGRRYWFTIPG